jgi:uncharacterized protein YjbI with pentapeptide repeats
VFERQEHDLTGSELRRVFLRGADMRGGAIFDSRLRGVDLWNIDIDGDLMNVRVNGVDIAPLVAAELDRRDPDRAKMRPVDAEGFREAWPILETRWAATVERARTFPEHQLHDAVGDEWSFVQTLRHLCFATDAESRGWCSATLRRGTNSTCRGTRRPGGTASRGIATPAAADEVLAVRAERQALVRGVIADLTDAQLTSTVTRTEPGWPQAEDFPVERCLRIVLNEEWQHRQFAERDLAALAAGAAGDA